MSHQSHDRLSKAMLRVNAAAFNDAELAPGNSTFELFVQRQPCPTISVPSSLEELGRLIDEDSKADAQIVHNGSDEVIEVVTSQCSLGSRQERKPIQESKLQFDIVEHKRVESLLAGEKRILEIIATSSSDSGGLRELVEFVETQFKGVACSILLMDDNGAQLRNGAANRLPDELVQAIDGLTIGPNAGACGTAAYLDQTVVVTDIATDPICQNVRELALRHGLRACWSSPIHSSSGKVLGTIAMYFEHPQAPDADHRALIDRAVDLAAIAIERKRSEDALRASETRSRTLLEDSPVCTKIIDLDSRLQYMSCAGQTQLKISDIEPLYGSTFPPDLYPEAWRAPIRDRLERAKAGELSSLVCPVLDTQGNEVWYDTTFVPARDDKGRVQYVIVTSVNVTERRLAVEALRASETRNRTLLEGSPVCTKIIDLKSRLQYMSCAGQTQLKISDIEPLYGSTFPPELYPEAWRAPVSERLDRAMAGEMSSLECPVHDTEGNELWFDTTFVPARDDSGRVQYVIVTSVNITERKEVEDELSTIFDMSLDLICVADINTATLVKVNPAFLRVLGYSEEEILGRTILDFVHPDDVAPTVEIFERDLKNGNKVMRFENRCRAKQGGYRWLAWNSNPNITSGLTYCIAHDITEDKNADERARKHRDELAHVSRVSTMGEMATGIAHELNQPLAAIATYSYAAKMMVDQSPSSLGEIQETLGKLEDQAIRAGEIVRRLRNYVKKTESARTRADLNKLVRNVASFVEPDIRQADLSLKLNLDESITVVRVDEIQIQQVLVNLIRNAVDAMQETPIGQRKVTLSTRILPDGQADVTVSDAGKGLADDELEQVFNAFFTTKQEGIGLGLPISRSIIEAHGGQLWSIANTGPGMTFGFTIPLETGQETDRSPTVFIVDDESTIRESLSLVVRNAGLTAKCFSSAVDFLEFINSYDSSGPACLIADVQMPKVNGIELLRQLEALNKKLPAILISGHGTASLKFQDEQRGAVALFEKPFRPSEIEGAILTTINRIVGEIEVQ